MTDDFISIRPLQWRGTSLRILDQRRLPSEEVYLEARDAARVAQAIATMAVRGAPVIGIAAGYGLALEALGSAAAGPLELRAHLEQVGSMLASARPTATNLARAVERVMEAIREEAPDGAEAMKRAAVEEARAVALEEERACWTIGVLGSELVPQGGRVLTHCNTGSLATGGCGTAQGIIVTAHRMGRVGHVWVDETRPLLQGSRLTAWELGRLGVPYRIVADAAAGSLMDRGLVDLVVVGADRIAANGDVANKIGTYQLAVLANRHGIPFLVAAPLSTVDHGTLDGNSIVIEERDPQEVIAPFGVRTAPEGAAAANPAFDITPARLVSGIVTDGGVARPPYRRSLARLRAGQPAPNRTAVGRLTGVEP